MEIHRLKQIEGKYDEQVLSRIYSKTLKLRKSLTHQIDHRRFNVTPDIIESWFVDKLLFVFAKYKDEPENIILAKVINSLQTFKLRILRKAYTDEAELNLSSLSIDDDETFFNEIPDEGVDSEREELLNIVDQYMKENLSTEAYMVFHIEFDPPQYISSRVSPNKRIPTRLMAEFLGVEDSRRNLNYVNGLRSEVQEAIVTARDHISVPA